MFAVSSKIQRSSHTLFIDVGTLSPACMQKSKRIMWLHTMPSRRGTGEAGERSYQCGGHTGRTSDVMHPKTSRGGLIEGPRVGGTQCAQRTADTVSGFKTTADYGKSGH
ncbi:hypothetical protein DPMN_176029 [Dreissena polymorpha]|uniref:Uncharacterized protein n=1 Tax=Dreissena polymorpha TaxID=45954 RepID=A0A9D4E970_DREPO|nr:hypothetical protein DPMN_176029 [Dreissena polymorpha]